MFFNISLPKRYFLFSSISKGVNGTETGYPSAKLETGEIKDGKQKTGFRPVVVSVFSGVGIS
jgi:hypothetical protein